MHAEIEAAVKIQSSYRGYRTRKTIKLQKKTLGIIEESSDKNLNF